MQLQQPVEESKKDVKRKGFGLGAFVLAALAQTAGPNKHEAVTKLLGTSVFFLLLMISADICIPRSKANTAF